MPLSAPNITEIPARILGAKCEGCSKYPLKEQYYLCLRCENYFLCCVCYLKQQVTKSHLLTHPVQLVMPSIFSSDLYSFDGFQNVSSITMYTCPYCGKGNFSDKELKSHVLTKHEYREDKVYCPICLGPYRCKLSDHIKRTHESLTTNNLSNPLTSSIFPDANIDNSWFAPFLDSDFNLKPFVPPRNFLPKIKPNVTPDMKLSVELPVITEEDQNVIKNDYQLLRSLLTTFEEIRQKLKNSAVNHMILTFVDKLLDFHQLKGYRQQLIWDSCQAKSLFVGLSMPPFMDTKKLSNALYQSETNSHEAFKFQLPSQNPHQDKSLGLMDSFKMNNELILEDPIDFSRSSPIPIDFQSVKRIQNDEFVDCMLNALLTVSHNSK